MTSTSPSPTTVPAPKTLLGLELMRFACALTVLVWHYQHFYYVGGAPVGFSREAQPWFEWLQPLYLHGFLGVQAFWCLSGFIFFWKYAKPVAQERVSGWRFAVLRFSRLYPLHLLTLLLVAVFAAAYQWQVGVGYVYTHNDMKHFALQLFMASDWGWQDGFSFNGPIWSISIEILAYTLFFALSRLGLTRWWHAAAVVAVTGVVYSLKLTEHPVVLCVFFFYLGGLTQQVHHTLSSLPAAWRGAALGVVVLALAAGTALAALGVLRPMFYVALLTPAAALLMLAWVHPRSARLAGLISALGNTTYASYLLHFPLQLALAAAIGAPLVERLPLGSPWWLAGYLVVVFALAAVVYRAIELPAQAWLRRQFDTPPRTEPSSLPGAR